MTLRIWSVVAACLAAAMGIVGACSSKESLLQTRDGAAGIDAPAATGGAGSGGATSAGGGGGPLPTGGAAGPGSGGTSTSTGGDGPPAGSGGAGGTPAAAGGGGGSGGAGVGGTGANQAGSGTGGHDVAPVMCGAATCTIGSQCCRGCNGSMTCAPTCTSPVCPADGGADAADAAPPIVCGGKTCGADEACCGPPSCGYCRNRLMGTGAPCMALCPALDAGADLPAGSIACGSGSCGPLEACVHPSQGGTCMMPDAGACPAGYTLQSGCCTPPDSPRCVAIDNACSGPVVTCACFSKDPCGTGCASAAITGRDVACAAAS